MYNKVHLNVDSAEVNSKENFGIFIFFTLLASLNILVSEIAYMSKSILFGLNKYSRSSKFLSEEQLITWNRERELFLLGIFIDWTFFKYFHLTTFSGVHDHGFEKWTCLQIWGSVVDIRKIEKNNRNTCLY